MNSLWGRIGVFLMVVLLPGLGTTSAVAQKSDLVPFPSYLSTAHLHHEARAVVADGTRVFVATGEEGLRELDLGSDGNLRERFRLDLPGRCQDVAVRSGMVYAACGSEGVAVVDVTSASVPVLLTRVANVHASAVVRSGTALVIAGVQGDRALLDITNPSAPTLLDQNAVDPSDSVCLRLYPEGLYLAAGEDGVFRLDWSSGALHQEPLVEAAGARDVAVRFDLLAVADDRAGTTLWRLRPGAPPQILWNDADDPAAVVRWHRNTLASLGNQILFRDQPEFTPDRFLGSLSYEGAAFDLVEVGDRWVIAAGPDGVHVVAPASGRGPVGRFGRDGSRDTSFQEGAVHRDRMYFAAGQRGVLVYERFALVPQLGVANFPGMNANTVAFEGDYGYIGVADSGVFVVDITAATTPTFVSRLWGISGGALDLKVRNGIGYAAAGDFGLWVLDFRDPANPVPLVNFPTVDNCTHVELSGNHAFLSLRSTGIQALDITDPSQPLPAGTAPALRPRGMDIHFPWLYLADDYNGMRVFNISDPDNLVEVSVTPSVNATDVLVDDNLAMVLNRYDGIRFYDVSDPAQPLILGDALPGLPLEHMLLNPAADQLFVSALQEGIRLVGLNRRLTSTVEDRGWRLYR